MSQVPIWNEPPQGEQHKADEARALLDELFDCAQRYRTGTEYMEMMRFVGRFRRYSLFNALLVHLQMPGARYVAPATRWLRDYARRVLPNERPLVILKPMGPVAFVYDISQTVPLDERNALPVDMLSPFQIRTGTVAWEMPTTIENAKRDGIRVSEVDIGAECAGAVAPVENRGTLRVRARVRPKVEFVEIPVRYQIWLDRSFSDEVKYATLAHELAHVYCGHQGTPNPEWWPDRRPLPQAAREFEAESVAYLVCSRIGIRPESHRYLASWMGNDGAIPAISLDVVIKAAGLIEQMGSRRLMLRKTREDDETTE